LLRRIKTLKNPPTREGFAKNLQKTLPSDSWGEHNKVRSFWTCRHSTDSPVFTKYYDLIFWCLFISLFSLFFLKVVSVSHLLMFITPLSILLGLLITKIKNSLFEETLHLIFVLTALFLQFQNW